MDISIGMYVIAYKSTLPLTFSEIKIHIINRLYIYPIKEDVKKGLIVFKKM